MAKYADDDDIGHTGVYADLLSKEEAKFARHGGRRILVGEHMVTVNQPNPTLAALRAGRPTEVMDWQLPRFGRSGLVKNVRVTVYPDGQMFEDDR